MTKIAPEVLLGEVDDLLRTMPPRATIRHETPENLAWFGRAGALVSEWNPLKSPSFEKLLHEVQSQYALEASQALKDIIIMLNQARHALRLHSVGPLSIVVQHGAVFDYFDEVRQVIEGATTDLLFVDPYIDAEFCSRYLPHVKPGVAVRLLSREKMTTLLPAVALYRKQAGLAIEVRSSPALHDRFVFCDRNSCYQSGASFKDGAKKSPTTLTQVVDAFAAIQATYESLWTSATPHP